MVKLLGDDPSAEPAFILTRSYDPHPPESPAKKTKKDPTKAITLLEALRRRLTNLKMNGKHGILQEIDVILKELQ